MINNHFKIILIFTFLVFIFGCMLILVVIKENNYKYVSIIEPDTNYIKLTDFFKIIGKMYFLSETFLNTGEIYYKTNYIYSNIYAKISYFNNIVYTSNLERIEDDEKIIYSMVYYTNYMIDNFIIYAKMKDEYFKIVINSNMFTNNISNMFIISFYANISNNNEIFLIDSSNTNKIFYFYTN